MYEVNLRCIRRKKGLSINTLSKLTGAPKSAISKIERGKGNPTLATINKLALVLGHEILVWKEGRK